jgi:hypothetical protein
VDFEVQHRVISYTLDPFQGETTPRHPLADLLWRRTDIHEVADP